MRASKTAEARFAFSVVAGTIDINKGMLLFRHGKNLLPSVPFQTEADEIWRRPSALIGFCRGGFMQASSRFFTDPVPIN